MDPFITNTMSLFNATGTLRASGLLCQVDTVNLPWNLEAQGMIPDDWYDIYSMFWTSPVPVRTDYLVVTSASPIDIVGTKYQVFSTIFEGPDTLQMRCTRYSGVTP